MLTNVTTYHISSASGLAAVHEVVHDTVDPHLCRQASSTDLSDALRPAAKFPKAYYCRHVWSCMTHRCRLP